MSKQQYVENLVNELKKYAYAYYNGEALVSDAMYDAKINVLRRIAPNHPFLSEVGAPVEDSANKVSHDHPMFTLSKTRDIKNWVKWGHETKYDLIVEPKYDGFAVSLQYIDGKLEMASTRGTGYIGEDVTEAMKHVVPAEIEEFKHAGTIELRGEVLAPRCNHDELKKMGYVAMRNAVPGIVRSCNEQALKELDFVCYEYYTGVDGAMTRIDMKDFLESIGGFVVAETLYIIRHGDDFENDFLNFVNDFDRNNYVYECDGLVMKEDIIRHEENTCPVWQSAFKYETDIQETVCTGIKFETGTTGKVAVVYEFEPVEFQGAKIGRASVGSVRKHNEFKTQVGDILYVTRVNDVIPMIKDVENIHGDESIFVPVSRCPQCGAPLVGAGNCSNERCTSKIYGGLVQWITSLKKGIGEATVLTLWNKYGVNSIYEFYKFDLDSTDLGPAMIRKLKEVQFYTMGEEEVIRRYPYFNGMKWGSWDKYFEEYCVDELLNYCFGPLKPAQRRSVESVLNNFNDDLIDILLLMAERNFGKM